MKLEDWVRAVESRLFNWFSSEQQRQEQTEERRQLLAEIRSVELERDRIRHESTLLKPRIDSLTQTVALLPSRIESSMARGKASQALRQSLELESQRRQLEEARQESARLENVLWSHEFRLRQLRRALAQLPSPFHRSRKR